jgi:glycosyltransferase involved in cell wall biosynthesis
MAIDRASLPSAERETSCGESPELEEILPRLSVVIPVCDRATYLREAVDAVRAQTLRDLEIILVDDGSTDETATLVDELAATDSRISALHVTHGGASRATNAGLAAARGEWIARLDSDDWIPPDRFSRQLPWMHQNGIDVCGMQVQRFGARSEPIWLPETPEAVAVELLFRPAMMQPVVMSREVAQSNPYLDGVTFDDYELQTRLVRRYRLANMGEVGLWHRVHASQTQSVRKTALRAELRKFRFRYFFQVYPNTPLGQYRPLADLADRLPLRTEAEFEVAGRWLVRLADSVPAEPALRRRMEQRWREAWARSSDHLPASAAQIFEAVLSLLVPEGAGPRE